MNGIETVMKQLRNLSYNDMMVLATQLAKTLQSKHNDKLDAHLVATSLLGLAICPPAPSVATQRDEQILTKVFSRKRQINVTRHHQGWEMQIPSLAGSQVMGSELRSMFPMMLDQVITMHVLQQGSR